MVTPRDLFAAGELTACAHALRGSDAFADRVLHCHALMRMARSQDALELVAATKPANPYEGAHLAALRGSLLTSLGKDDEAAGVLSAVPTDSFGDEIDFELAYARMLLAWIRNDAAGMEFALRNSPASASVIARGRWLYATAWAAAMRRDYSGQLELLRRAIDHLTKIPTARDVSLLAPALRSYVHLAREISAPDAHTYASLVADQLPWTADLGNEQFLTIRGLAWVHALRGSYQRAMAYAYQARDLAPSPMWRTACYADQAYLARMANQTLASDAALEHAVKCAFETNWDSPAEERVAILNLIELTADQYPGRAKQLMDLYDKITVGLSPHLAIARDNRFPAMEDYARAHVLAATHPRESSISLLESAYDRFSAIGYAWRAAASALRLHFVTENQEWLIRASEAVAGFSDSSVAYAIRKHAARVADPRVASLTPAQRKIFELLRTGLRDKEIANRLKLSPQTVRNQSARIREAFNVRTRAGLAAAAAQNIAV